MDSTLEKHDEPKPSIPLTPSFDDFSVSCPTAKPSWDPLYKAMALSFFVDSSNFSLTRSSSLPGNLIPTPEVEKMRITTKEGSEEWEKKKNFYEFIVSKKKSLEENEGNGLCGEFKNGKFVEMGEGYDCERRRQSVSFGAAQAKVADIFAGNGVKIVAVDMPTFMQIHAVNCARKSRDGMEKFTSKALASTLKKEFDGVYGPAWHCIVGSSFGSFVTHSVGGFLYFSVDQKLYILLFRTAVQRAD